MNEEDNSIREQLEKPTKEEVKMIINTNCNGKATGTVGLNVEQIKCGAKDHVKKDTILLWIYGMKRKCQKNGTKNKLSRSAKKGDKQSCNYYRGLPIFNTFNKILSILVERRLTKVSKIILR